MIVGDAIVPTGVHARCHGMVTGDLIVEVRGHAEIYGMVNGTVVNKGAKVIVHGIVGAVRDEAGIASVIHPRAIVTRPS